jgi:hypothetical protein
MLTLDSNERNLYLFLYDAGKPAEKYDPSLPSQEKRTANTSLLTYVNISIITYFFMGNCVSEHRMKDVT